MKQVNSDQVGKHTRACKQKLDQTGSVIEE